MPDNNPITVRVNLTPKQFRRFACFDAFIRLKRWIQPLLFLCLMAGFSALCFFPLRDKPQSSLLGGVLLAIGLFLPIAYFGRFFTSLRSLSKKQKLPRPVYELTLGNKEDGLSVQSLTNQDEHLKLEWEKLFAAYRREGCVYLYILPNKAFILPDGQSDASDEAVWQRIADLMPKGKAHTR